METDFVNTQRINFLSMPLDEQVVHFVPYVFDIEHIEKERYHSLYDDN